MIEHQQEQYQWHFTFLGANQDSFGEASAMGMTRGGAANYSSHRVAATYQAAASKVSRMRGQARSGETIDNDFTEEEREQMR